MARVYVGLRDDITHGLTIWVSPLAQKPTPLYADPMLAQWLPKIP
jgi:hypothetical protein